MLTMQTDSRARENAAFSLLKKHVNSVTIIECLGFGQLTVHKVAVLCWSAAAPDEWTVVPLLVKVYKLVINELSNQIEKSTSTRATTGDEDEV